MNELNLFLELKNGEKRYLELWFSDNPPFDINNAGCIGISLYDENMDQIDGGELDYTNDTTKLKNMINDCIEFMNLSVKTIKEITTEEMDKKFEEVSWENRDTYKNNSFYVPIGKVNIKSEVKKELGGIKENE